MSRTLIAIKHLFVGIICRSHGEMKRKDKIHQMIIIIIIYCSSVDLKSREMLLICIIRRSEI